MSIRTEQPQATPDGTTADPEFVRRAVAGDREAFATLVERHHARILALLERLCGCRELAHDLAQETFLSAYRNLPSFAHKSAFSTWLHSIACNHAAAVARRKKPALVLDAPTAGGPGLEPVAATPPAWARLERQELAQRVAAALACLDDRYRQVVVLSDMQGASYEEIAATLDIPLGTVRSRLHRGRLELRTLLKTE